MVAEVFLYERKYHMYVQLFTLHAWYSTYIFVYITLEFSLLSYIGDKMYICIFGTSLPLPT